MFAATAASATVSAVGRKDDSDGRNETAGGDGGCRSAEEFAAKKTDCMMLACVCGSGFDGASAVMVGEAGRLEGSPAEEAACRGCCLAACLTRAGAPAVHPCV